ncbi:hypothetical protein IAT38_003502 [Cryptococcus sp. DSM 104549]
MAPSGSHPWARHTPTSSISISNASPHATPTHQLSQGFDQPSVLAAAAFEPTSPSRSHARATGVTSVPNSPSNLRVRSSPRKAATKSSPRVAISFSSPVEEDVFAGDRPAHGRRSSGAESIIRGTGKWLKEKLDVGGGGSAQKERKTSGPGWVPIDAGSPISPGPVNPGPEYSTGTPARRYDSRGCPLPELAAPLSSFPTAGPGPGLSSAVHSSDTNSIRSSRSSGSNYDLRQSDDTLRLVPPRPIIDTAVHGSAPSPLLTPARPNLNRSNSASSQYGHSASPTTPQQWYPGMFDSPLDAVMNFTESHHGSEGLGSQPVYQPSIHGGHSRSSLLSENGSSETWRREDEGLVGGRVGRTRWQGKGPFVGNKGQQQVVIVSDILPFHMNPAMWAQIGPEDDDDFHDPDFKHGGVNLFSRRGIANMGCLTFMAIALVVLFAGYPIISGSLSHPATTLGAYNLGGINATGQIPDIIGLHTLVDPETPAEAYKWTSMETGEQWDLVFSDEFNDEGRTFFDGDDPYWEAVDLHYWQTNNLEWYDPGRITTKNGKLVITLDKIANRGLNFEGGMMSSWNRFCFTGGYIEVAVSLPGRSDVPGLWPAVWTMGNLGRAGYGGSLDGMWPYSYDTCDVGTLPNQTLNGLPKAALTTGDPTYDDELSYLPGQRLSRCTCSNDETHPGPQLSDGTWVGRAAPEIDIFEATIDTSISTGEVSQSSQWAPFNPHYSFLNTSDKYYEVFDDDATKINEYMGSVYQQATSGLSVTDQDCYTAMSGCLSKYGFEYAPGGDGYITWVNDGKKAWTIRGAAMGPNSEAQVGQRVVSEEPMYIIFNLGISENFGAVDFHNLDKLWPATMEVDYVRVYQDPKAHNIGCNPPDRPTASYIARYPEAYSNPNITTFDEVPNGILPKNKLVDTC